ncbi:MAG: NUDIX domain-containing protein [Actinomycetales bacterium]|nr:NUDIX domain-containing protein [Actinomycetales bacterium]
MELRVAAYAIVHDDEGRVLLSHLAPPGGDVWTLPGGGIDPGEDPRDAAVREVLEETGLRVELEELIGVDSIVMPAADRAPGLPDMHWIRIVYRAHVTGGELCAEVDGSTDGAAWHTPAELDALGVVELVGVGRRLAAF